MRYCFVLLAVLAALPQVMGQTPTQGADKAVVEEAPPGTTSNDRVVAFCTASVLVGGALYKLFGLAITSWRTWRETSREVTDADSKVFTRRRESELRLAHKDQDFVLAKYQRLADDLHREMTTVKDESKKLQAENVQLQIRCSQLESKVEALQAESKRNEAIIESLEAKLRATTSAQEN